jgi:iron complex outermembrane receptor protein
MELEAALRPHPAWEIRGDATWTWGEINNTGAPLPQIPAIQGSLSATRDGETWGMGGRIHAAGRQTRVDSDPTTGTGLDLGETPGYLILDLYGNLELGGTTKLSLGVANVLDKTWANHLNRENGVDNTVVRVQEPGRSLYARVAMRY